MVNCAPTAVKRVFLLLAGLTLTAAVATAAAVSFSGTMPKELRGMTPEAKQAAAGIQDIVNQQRGMIEKARQAKTPQERREIFQAIARNVQLIAQKRVVIMEQYTERARARVEWAQKHASEVRVVDLVRAMDEIAQQGPRSPFDEEPAAQRADEPAQRAGLPKKVLLARTELEQTVKSLESLAKGCKETRSNHQREKIKQEIKEHLKTIEKERVAILEAVLEVSQQRLQHARQRAKEASGPSATGPENRPDPPRTSSKQAKEDHSHDESDHGHKH